MPARLSAFVIWALVAAGGVFWGYRFWASPLAVPPNVQTVSEGATARGDLTRLLGAAPVVASVAPAAVAESSRFRLLGVLAPVPASGAAIGSTAGVALVSVDGKPARAYRVGARLDGDLYLLSVARRSAAIGPAQGAPSVLLELAPPQPPATGSLTKALPEGEPARAAPPMALPQVQPTAQAPEGGAPEDAGDAPPRRRNPVGPATR